MSLARDGRFLFLSQRTTAAAISDKPGVTVTDVVCELGSQVGSEVMVLPSAELATSVLRVHAHPQLADAHVVLQEWEERVAGHALTVRVLSVVTGVDPAAPVRTDVLRTTQSRSMGPLQQQAPCDFVVRDRDTALVLAGRGVYEVSLQAPVRAAGARRAAVAEGLPPGPPLFTVPATLMAAPRALAWDERRHILWVMSSRGEVATWLPSRPAPTSLHLVQRLFFGGPTQMAVEHAGGSLVVLLQQQQQQQVDFLVISRAGEVAQLCSARQDVIVTGFAVVEQGAGAWRTHPSLIDVEEEDADADAADAAAAAAGLVLLCVTGDGNPVPRRYGAPRFVAAVHADIWACVRRQLRWVASSRIIIKCQDSNEVIGNRQTLAARIGYFGQRFGQPVNRRVRGRRAHHRAVKELKDGDGSQTVAVIGSKRKAWPGLSGSGEEEEEEEEGDEEGEDDDEAAASGEEDVVEGGEEEEQQQMEEQEQEQEDAMDREVDVNAHDTVVACVVRWAHTGELRLTRATAVGVVALAQQWDLQAVVQQCEEWLIDHLGLTNQDSQVDQGNHQVEALKQAEELGLPRLRRVALARMAAAWGGKGEQERREIVEALKDEGGLIVALMGASL